MNLKELKEKVDYLYERYGGEINVLIELTTNLDKCEALFTGEEEDGTWVDNVVDVTEVLDIPPERIGEIINLDKEPELVSDICISNYYIDNEVEE